MCYCFNISTNGGVRRMSTDTNRTNTQRDLYFVRTAKETETWKSLTRKLRDQHCVPSSSRPKRTLNTVLAVYCTYKRNVETRLSVTQKGNNTEMLCGNGTERTTQRTRQRWKDTIKVDKDTRREGVEWIHMDHDTNQLELLWTRWWMFGGINTNAESFFTLWPTVSFYCCVE
jgi:hypothetical protein